MTFKGDKIIGKPTFAMVEICIAERGYECEPLETFNYWDKKKWITKKGNEIATLENAVQVYNGIVVQRKLKEVAKEIGFAKISKKNKDKVKKKYKQDKEERIKDKSIINAIMLESMGLKDNKEKSKKPEWKPYDEQLHDKKWLAFRKFIFEVRGKRCEMCGEKDRLQVHHPKYRKGALAWEYNCNEVQVLCRDCHKAVHGIKD